MRLPRTWKKTAFTLLEILVVVLILSFLLTISLPRMNGTYRNSQLRMGVRDIVSLLKYARAEAVTKRKWVEVRMNLDQHEYQLDLMIDGVRILYREEEDIPLSPEEKIRVLNDMVQFTSVVTYDDRIEEEDDSIVVLRFYPRGTATAATIVMQTVGKNPNEQAYMTIELYSTTGAVEVYPGKPETDGINQYTIEVDAEDADYSRN